jgi:hypothetical protein
MLLTSQVKSLPLAAVKPFVVSVPPLPDESLLGFAARSLSKTAVRRLVTGLSLAGIGTLRPEAVPVSLNDLAQIDALAKLLGTNSTEIISRLIERGTTVRSMRGFDFYGLVIRKRYREYRFRRVSPLALAASDHYRAIWDLRCLTFDPETLEPLVDQCPVCSHKLDWLRCLGIPKCNHCLDERGLPTIDLRDFPGEPLPIDDRDALLLAARIASVDPDQKRKALESVPAPWDELEPSDLFETLMSCAMAMAESPTVIRPPTFAKVDEWIVSPEMLTAAGRMILDGNRGLRDVLHYARQKREERATSVGNFAEFGAFGLLRHSDFMSSAAIEIIERGIAHELSMAPARRSVDWSIRSNDGRIDLRAVSRSHGISMGRLKRLTDAGLVPFATGGHRAKAIRVRPEDIQPIVDELPMAASAASIAELLNVSEGCLGFLVSKNHLRPASPATNKVLGPDDHYMKKSAMDLRSRLLEAIPAATGIGGLSVRAFMDSKKVHMGRWGACLHLLSLGVGLPTKLSNGGDWRDAIRVHDAAGLEAALNNTPMDQEFVELETAGKIIGSPLPKIEALARAKMLKRLPHAGVRFSRADVMAFAAEFMLGAEISQLLGARSLALGKLLKSHGIKPVVRLPNDRGLVYLRSEIEHMQKVKPSETAALQPVASLSR